MASINLKHTSGNGTILNSPAANPSSDITLKLPSTTGSAGQVLSVASANHSSTNAELEFVAAGGGKVLQVVSTTKQDTASQASLGQGEYWNLTSLEYLELISKEELVSILEKYGTDPKQIKNICKRNF